MNKADLKTAEQNFERFHKWLKAAFPVKLPWQVFAEQKNDVMEITKVWRYGSVSHSEKICDLQLYPRFDPDFNPETFYSK